MATDLQILLIKSPYMVGNQNCPHDPVAPRAKDLRACALRPLDKQRKEECRPLLAANSAALRADFARYWATRVQGAAQGLALRPEAFDSLAALEADMVTLDEIKEDARQFGTQQGLEQGRQQGLEQGRLQGLEQGRQQGLEQGRLQEKENNLVELVDLFWGQAAGQAFRKQLTRRHASRWPAIRDLHAARQAGRDPFSLLDALD